MLVRPAMARRTKKTLTESWRRAGSTTPHQMFAWLARGRRWALPDPGGRASKCFSKASNRRRGTSRRGRCCAVQLVASRYYIQRLTTFVRGGCRRCSPSQLSRLPCRSVQRRRRVLNGRTVRGGFSCLIAHGSCFFTGCIRMASRQRFAQHKVGRVTVWLIRTMQLRRFQ